MTRVAPGTLLRVLVPVAAGAALSVALQAAEPAARLYATVSPSLLAGTAGLLGSCLLVVRVVVRRRAAASEAAAADGTVAALTSVSAQADRINRLVSDLRKLADLETQEIEAAPVDLPGLLREVTEAIGEIPAASERVIRVTVPRAPWPLPLIEGDRDLLFIAIQNLVANAVKFSAPGDVIEVRASEDDDGLLLEVADTGAGIPADEIGQVWQELARGRAARSLPGTGIGLALVRVIITRHGGRVAIRSREGQGTVVSIRLPAPDRARTAPAVAALRQHRDTPGMTAV